MHAFNTVCIVIMIIGLIAMVGVLKINLWVAIISAFQGYEPEPIGVEVFVNVLLIEVGMLIIMGIGWVVQHLIG